MASDDERVRELLGREPRGDYEIVVRDRDGDPVVLRNAPLLHDGTPMPTRYWLIGPAEIRRVGHLESEGGVDRAEAELDPAEVQAAHDRYAAERDALIPADHDGPRPTGGVGGTRIGLKCLHAHWAWHLAGGDDPVGRWIERELAVRERATLVVTDDALVVTWDDRRWTFPVGVDHLRQRWLDDGDPPKPAALTNALGDVADHVDDVVRDRADAELLDTMAVVGVGIRAIAQLESGLDEPPMPYRLDRDTAEEIFRLAATEPRADRAHNPGLPSGDVDTVLASLCAVVSVMRRLGPDAVDPSGDAASIVCHSSSLFRRQPSPRLYGKRVMLRLLAASDFGEWHEVRTRNEHWLVPWEPKRPASSADPTRHRAAFEHRCTARAAQRQADSRLSVRGCSSTSVSPARSTSTTSRACCRARRSGTGSTRPAPAGATSPRASWSSPGTRSRNSTSIVSRSASCRATPTADA
ncbi:MAG: DUF501 domain-containing protein [Ilumatobacteraceae bacterium]